MSVPCDSPADVPDLLRQILDELRGTKVNVLLWGKSEVAAALGVGVSTLDSYVKSGVVGPAEFKIGGQLKWDRLEVEAWVRNRNKCGELYDRETWPAVWDRLSR